MEADGLWYWMNERHRIWMVRQAGVAKPWTDDKILQNYRFCNVFRELDVVTEWIRRNWRDPYDDNENMWLGMTVARFVNWPDTLAELGFPDEGWTDDYRDRFIRVIERRISKGLQAYTGAYMVRGDIQGGYKAKSEYLAYKVIGPMWEERWRILDALKEHSIEHFVGVLCGFYGLSGFMSYEIATDLRWTRWLGDANDIFTWANAGPGAMRGLNRVFSRDVRKGMKQEQALHEMRILLAMSRNAKMNAIRIDGRILEMRDIEHSLCEFDKYERVRLREGKPRARYNGAG